jgi:hypothetical protein
VNKSATRSRGCEAGVACLQPGLYATRYEREGRGLEARPAVGHLWGGWSQWRNRLPHEAEEVACCETRLVGPFGYGRTPEMVRVLDRGYANFGELPFHALGWIKTGR